MRCTYATNRPLRLRLLERFPCADLSGSQAIGRIVCICWQRKYYYDIFTTITGYY